MLIPKNGHVLVEKVPTPKIGSILQTSIVPDGLIFGKVLDDDASGIVDVNDIVLFYEVDALECWPGNKRSFLIHEERIYAVLDRGKI